MTEDSSYEVPVDHRVVQVYRFDRRQGESVDDWAEVSSASGREIQVAAPTCRTRPTETGQPGTRCARPGRYRRLRLGDPGEKNPSVVGTDGAKALPGRATMHPQRTAKREVWRGATLGSNWQVPTRGTSVRRSPRADFRKAKAWRHPAMRRAHAGEARLAQEARRVRISPRRSRNTSARPSVTSPTSRRGIQGWSGEDNNSKCRIKGHQEEHSEFVAKGGAERGRARHVLTGLRCAPKHKVAAYTGLILIARRRSADRRRQKLLEGRTSSKDEATCSRTVTTISRLASKVPASSSQRGLAGGARRCWRSRRAERDTAQPT